MRNTAMDSSSQLNQITSKEPHPSELPVAFRASGGRCRADSGGPPEGPSMKKIISRKLALAAGIGLAALAGPVAGAGTASASTSPVVYGAHLDSWHAYIKPASFYFGNGAAPRITNLTWKSWGSNTA